MRSLNIAYPFVFIIGLSNVLAYSLPPPPAISRVNGVGLYREWSLGADEAVPRIIKGEGDFIDVNLNGHLLTVGLGGVNSIGSTGQLIIKNGRITSIDGLLRLSSSSYHYNQLDIDAVICDAPTHKVGLRVSGAMGAYRLIGSNSNTFTGDVEVSGQGQYFALAKSAGVTAVLGNIHVRDGALAGIDNSNQISDSSTVTLSGEGVTFGLLKTYRVLSEAFYKLSVNSFSNGVLLFGHDEYDSFEKSLFLEELEIGGGAFLNIEGWMADRDHLFVKKTSRYFEDALAKIRLIGHSGQVGIKDYGKGYWEIGVGAGFRPLPEPETYGAAFSVAVLGLSVWRRKRRKVDLDRENGCRASRRLLPATYAVSHSAAFHVSQGTQTARL